jgi:hypothetical protein
MIGEQFEDGGRMLVNAKVQIQDIMKENEVSAGNSLHPRNASNVNNMARRKTKSTKTKRNRNVRNNFTYMFITIIVCYILSYLPTFVTILLATGDPFHFWYSMNTIVLNIVMLLRRSSIINHVVNPIIYGYFDLAFRKAFTNFFQMQESARLIGGLLFEFLVGLQSTSSL